ncbi:hypothetical protein D6C91_10306 [Aureobasidium pullulans]|uniref:Uncharacterized protein n=1 Tax=Aureobasidium pullulans TaxID=5580 RepID=A0A4S9S8R3_AURPU|nr:hypothetical protein D6C91_10306 [Aureobasidium pullulans]
MLRAAVLETLETMQGMADTGIVDKKFGKKALAMFEALETESDSSGSQSNDSDDDLSDKEVDEDEEDKGSNDGEGADGEDEPDVPVKPHTRRFPELALVETLVVADLAPFETFEPAWPGQLLGPVSCSPSSSLEASSPRRWRAFRISFWMFSPAPVLGELQPSPSNGGL